MLKPHLLRAATVAAMLLAPLQTSRAVEETGSRAGSTAPPPAWPTSPFHGVISGATGEPIPCRCRHQGSAYRLGDTVCMRTLLGVQLARCDLVALDAVLLGEVGAHILEEPTRDGRR